MSNYWWQPETFPLASGDEIRYGHFEAIRRNAWLLEHLGAGTNFLDYENDCYTSGTWNAYCDSFVGLFPMKPAANGIYNVLYKGANEEEGDLYSSHTGFDTLADMKAQKPCDADGVLNSSYWTLVPDPNFYHDFDFNAGRKFCKFTSSEEHEHLYNIPSWRESPRHVDPACQKPRIQYPTRQVPNLGWVELAKRFLSQPTTMGALYNFEVWCSDEGSGSTHRRTKMALGIEVGQVGEQYSKVPGESGTGTSGVPSGADPAVGAGDGQYYYDKKICNAYQNMVERICSIGGWCYPLDGALGDIWIDNFNAAALEPFINETIPEWDGGPYTYPQYVWHNDRIWSMVAYEDSTLEPSIEVEQYAWILRSELYGDNHNHPVSVPLSSEYWGCNESAFEWCLMALGKYDWYYDTGIKYKPYTVDLNQHIEEVHGGEDSADVLAAWPNPHGTWRRTWKYSFGRVGDWQRPYEMGTPDSEVYSDFQEDAGGITATPFWWSGICTITEPDDLELSETNEALIASRHDPYKEDDYEIVAQMLNDMWDVLELLNHRYLDITVVLKNRSGGGTIDSGGYPSLLAAYNKLKADADTAVEAKSWEPASSRLWGPGGTLGYWGGATSTGSYWLGGLRHDQLGFEITGGWDDGRKYTSEIFLRLVITEYNLSSTPYPLTYAPVFEVGFPDGSTESFQSKAIVGTMPWEFAYEARVVPVSAADEEIIPINFVGPDPVPVDRAASLGGSVDMASRIDLEYIGSSYGEGIGFGQLNKADIPAAVFNTIRHRNSIVKGTDPGMFNNNGFLI